MRRFGLALMFVFLSNPSWAQSKKTGADRQEGWIIRKSESGNLIKVPKKQFFIFDGSEISGQIDTPAQSILQKRPSRKRRSLIPERYSFRREGLDSVGFQGR